MASIQARIARKMLQVQPYGWAKGSLDEQRSRQEKTARFFRIPGGIRFEPIHFNAMDAEWITCAAAQEGVILYLHGGAYALGSIHVYQEYLSRLALATQRKVLAINYRLAPEHPFPAALEDAVAAYRWLLSAGIDSSRIVIAGDSAGGGLALAALVFLRDACVPLPSGAVCFSPWLDVSLSGDSVREKAAVDPILRAADLQKYAGYYAGTHDLKSPLISPLFANLAGLPPLLVQVGGDEILLDDSIRLSKVAHQAGVDITLEVLDGLFHVFQIIPFLPETSMALEHVRDFLNRIAGNHAA